MFSDIHYAVLQFFGIFFTVFHAPVHMRFDTSSLVTQACMGARFYPPLEREPQHAGVLGNVFCSVPGVVGCPCLTPHFSQPMVHTPIPVMTVYPNVNTAPFLLLQALVERLCS